MSSNPPNKGRSASKATTTYGSKKGNNKPTKATHREVTPSTQGAGATQKPASNGNIPDNVTTIQQQD
jgi:hypothetical protein